MKVFQYKLDFFYQQAIMYLVTFILYLAIRGTFTDEHFVVVYNDPIAIIMLFFVLFASIMIAINRIRKRRIIVEADGIRFANRFKEWALPISDIEWMHITKEKRVQTSGRMQAVIIKRKSRKRLIRIRVGRYDRPNDFIETMIDLSNRVPKRGKRTLKDKIKRK